MQHIDKQILEVEAEIRAIESKGCDDEHSKQKISDLQKKKGVLQDEKNCITNNSQTNSEVEQKQLENSSKLFQLGNFESNRINVFTYSPKWLKGFFKFGKLPAFAYNMLVHGRHVFQPAMERLECNSVQQSRELRRRLYCLLGIQCADEYVRSGVAFVKEQVAADGASRIVLEETVKLSVGER